MQDMQKSVDYVSSILRSRYKKGPIYDLIRRCPLIKDNIRNGNDNITTKIHLIINKLVEIKQTFEFVCILLL